MPNQFNHIKNRIQIQVIRVQKYSVYLQFLTSLVTSRGSQPPWSRNLSRSGRQAGSLLYNSRSFTVQQHVVYCTTAGSLLYRQQVVHFTISRPLTVQVAGSLLDNQQVVYCTISRQFTIQLAGSLLDNQQVVNCTFSRQLTVQVEGSLLYMQQVGSLLYRQQVVYCTISRQFTVQLAGSLLNNQQAAYCICHEFEFSR